jgi:hypothetical protein
VDPGALIADIGHFEEIAVEPCLANGVLEEGLMRPWGAGSDEHPVQSMLFDDLLHLLLSILGAGIEVILHVDDIR